MCPDGFISVLNPSGVDRDKGKYTDSQCCENALLKPRLPPESHQVGGSDSSRFTFYGCTKYLWCGKGETHSWLTFRQCTKVINARTYGHVDLPSKNSRRHIFLVWDEVRLSVCYLHVVIHFSRLSRFSPDQPQPCSLRLCARRTVFDFLSK